MRTVAANLIFTAVGGILLLVGVNSKTFSFRLQTMSLVLAVALVWIAIKQVFHLLEPQRPSATAPYSPSPANSTVRAEPIRNPSTPPRAVSTKVPDGPVIRVSMPPTAPVPIAPTVKAQPIPVLTGPPDQQLASLLSSPLTLQKRRLPAGDEAVLVSGGQLSVLIKIYTGYQRIEDLQSDARTKMLRPLLKEAQGLTSTSALLWLPSTESRRVLDSSGAEVFSGTPTQLAGLLNANLIGGTADGPVMTSTEKSTLLEELARSLPAQWKLVLDVPMQVARPIDSFLVYQTSLAVALNLFAPADEYLLPDPQRLFRWLGVVFEDPRPSNFVAQLNELTGLPAVAWIPDRRMNIIRPLAPGQTVLIGGPLCLMSHLGSLVPS